jgi:hypothetical protein
MAVSTGPIASPIIQDAVILLDADDINSVKGEPTTNVVPGAYVMDSWSNYNNGTPTKFLTEFGTIGYRMHNLISWNGVVRGITLPSTGTYTFSAWLRVWAVTSGQNGGTVYISNSGLGYDVASYADTSKIGVWQRLTYTVNCTNTNITFYLISFGGDQTGTYRSTWEVTMPQIESKSYATPFVMNDSGSLSTTTRSTTTSVFDMGYGKHTLTANNTPFAQTSPVNPLASQSTLQFTNTNASITVDGNGQWGSNARTFEMWVKMNGSNATYMPMAVMTNASSITFNERFWLGVQNSRAQWHGWGSDDPQGSTVITDNVWHQVVYSYDNTSKLMKVYTDGVLENTTTNVNEGANIAASANQKWYIGGDPLGTTWTGGASNNFNGNIGIFRQYNRILQDYEVTQLFNIYAPRFGKTPKLIGTTPDNPAARSTDILSANPSAATGWYWIAAGNDVGRFWVDMSYSGGGWVLVLNNRAGNGGMPSLSYVDATKKVINFRSTSSTSPGVNYGNHYTPNNFNLWVGLDAWKSIIDANSSFKKIAYFVSTSYRTLGDTGNHTKRSSWSWTGWSSTYALQGASNLSNEVGASTPGWYNYHIANGYSLTTFDNDQDVYGSNCSTSYNNAPWWYGACWSGNIWGYDGTPYWESSGADNHNYAAAYIK